MVLTDLLPTTAQPALLENPGPSDGTTLNGLSPFLLITNLRKRLTARFYGDIFSSEVPLCQVDYKTPQDFCISFYQ